MKKRCLIGLLTLLCLFTIPLGSVNAGTVADFYKNKTITITLAAGLKGGFGQYCLLMKSYLKKHMEGHPNVMCQARPGGGGVKAANWLMNVAPKDGTHIGTPLQSVVLTKVLRPNKLKYDPMKFQWIAGADEIRSVILVHKRARIRTFSDLVENRVILGASSVNSTNFIIPAAMNSLLGTQFKLVTGYRGGSGVYFQNMANGELQGTVVNWTVVKIMKPGWIKDGTIVPVTVISEETIPELPKVPPYLLFAKTDEAREILAFIARNGIFGRAWFAPDGVPMERVVALRKAYTSLLRDPEFQAVALSKNMPVSFVHWSRLQEATRQIMSANPNMVTRLRSIIKEQAGGAKKRKKKRKKK